MSFNIVFEETDFKSRFNHYKLMKLVLDEIEKATKKFVQQYADEHKLSFECAEKILVKYYDVSIGVDITDDKCYCVFTSKLKDIEDILDSDIDISLVCEKELWS